MMLILFLGFWDGEAWRRTALEELNRLRQAHGSPPVRLVMTGLARRKAENLQTWGVFSHYSPRGYGPLLPWSRVWGKDAFEENLYALWTTGGPGFLWQDGGMERAVRDGLQMMVARDAPASWHHRRSLLDPCHTHADIGVAAGRDTFYLVVYMITARVHWTLRPSWRFPEFSMAGRLDPALNPDSLQVFILRDVPDPGRVKQTYYTPGEPVAGVVPPDLSLHYPNLLTLPATRWRVSGQDVEIRFSWDPPDPGVYTVQVQVPLREGVPYEPRPGVREVKRGCTILLYSVEKGGYR